MNFFLKHFSKTIPEFKHAVLVVDQAGWHKSLEIKIPQNISFIYLPPYSPELNPIEQVWQQLKQKWFSNRCYKNYEEIVNATVEAWNAFSSLPGAVKNLTSRNWAVLEG